MTDRPEHEPAPGGPEDDELPPGPTARERLARIRWTPARVAWLGAAVVVLATLVDLGLLRVYTDSGLRIDPWLATVLRALTTTLAVLGPGLLAVALGAALLGHRPRTDPDPTPEAARAIPSRDPTAGP